ncbi:unnamed protein product [Effrenium voratum]|nr:unnamed protein product [Effrenium voratum]
MDDGGMDVMDDAGDIPMAEQHAFLDQAKKYNFEKVREMVEAKPGLVNVQPAGRWSALHQAAEAGDEGTVRYLLEKGALLTVTTSDGRTPLQVAKGNVRPLLGGPAKRAAEPAGYAAGGAWNRCVADCTPGLDGDWVRSVDDFLVELKGVAVVEPRES